MTKANGAGAFHEKAGECQPFLFFSFISSFSKLFPFGPSRFWSPPFHPHSLLSDRRGPQSAPALRPHENSLGGGFGRSAEPKVKLGPESGVGADRLPDSGDTAGVEDAASHSEADDVASDPSRFLFLG